MTAAFEQIDRLVAIVGRWDLNAPARPIYEAPQAEFDRPFGIAVSGVNFAEGEARVTIKIPEFSKESDASGRLLIGYRAVDSEYLLVGVGGSRFAYSFYQFQVATGWQPLLLCGDANNIVPGKEYKISVRVKGQRVIFKEDDVTIFDYLLKLPPPLGQLGIFTWGKKRVEFANLCVRQERGLAFVIMQFTEPYLSLYNEVIKPVVESDKFKLNIHHAGESFGRVILEDVIRGIEEARVIIAEITPTNKNVFYELGYSHAMKKAAILLIEKGSIGDLPFDIKGYRCILYENTIAGKRQVESELEKNLAAILG